MTSGQVVIEVGPASIRGSRNGEPWAPAPDLRELIEPALDAAGECLTLIDDRPVLVSALWRTLLPDCSDFDVDTATVVYPSWWQTGRIALVCNAVAEIAETVRTRKRADVLAGTAMGGSAAWCVIVVEIAPHAVAISLVSSDEPHAGLPIWFEQRMSTPDRVADSVASEVDRRWRSLPQGRPRRVIVDAPADVAGAPELAALIATTLRSSIGAGSLVRTGSDDILRAISVLDNRERPGPGATASAASPNSLLGRGILIAASVATLALVLIVMTSVSERAGDGPVPGPPTMMLVEGRIAVKVPSQWIVQRVTAGPGSARVQVASPSNPEVALHLTQARVPTQESLAHTAETLVRAADAEPSGVFVDFNPANRRGGREVLTYREVRAAHHIRWAILIDRGVRISIGCQSPPGREDLITGLCDLAIESAHTLTPLPAQ